MSSATELRDAIRQQGYSPLIADWAATLSAAEASRARLDPDYQPHSMEDLINFARRAAHLRMDIAEVLDRVLEDQPGPEPASAPAARSVDAWHPGPRSGSRFLQRV